MEPIKNGTEIIKTMSKKQLCEKYGVCMETLNKWIKLTPGLVIDETQRLLTPAQVRAIYSHHGEP